ncbi:hypothetical protein RCL1_004310 [Eukaryota sp. TZLM3-RCL]
MKYRTLSHHSLITSIALHSDLLCVSDDFSVYVCDASSTTGDLKILSSSLPGVPATSMSFSPSISSSNPLFIALACVDGELKIVNVDPDTYSLIPALTVPLTASRPLIYSLTDLDVSIHSHVAVSSMQGSPFIFDVASSSLLPLPAYSLPPATSVAFKPDGKLLLQGHNSGMVTCFDLNLNVLQFSSKVSSSVTDISWYSDQSFLIADSTGTLSLFDLRNLSLPISALSHDGPFKLCPGPKGIATFGHDNLFSVYKPSLDVLSSFAFSSVSTFTSNLCCNRNKFYVATGDNISVVEV